MLIYFAKFRLFGYIHRGDEMKGQQKQVGIRLCESTIELFLACLGMPGQVEASQSVGYRVALCCVRICWNGPSVSVSDRL